MTDPYDMVNSMRFHSIFAVRNLVLGVAIATAAKSHGDARPDDVAGVASRDEGSFAVPGLSAPVTIERDSIAVPVIRGESLADVARGLGFIHAQERFFQMDLARRYSAGELAALIGP